MDFTKEKHQVLVSSPPSAGLITRTRSLFWPEGVKLKASHHQPVNVASITHTQWVVYTGLLPAPTTHSTHRQRNNRQEKWLTKTWIFCLEFQLHGGRVVICFSVGPTHDGLDWVERVLKKFSSCERAAYSLDVMTRTSAYNWQTFGGRQSNLWNVYRSWVTLCDTHALTYVLKNCHFKNYLSSNTKPFLENENKRTIMVQVVLPVCHRTHSLV